MARHEDFKPVWLGSNWGMALKCANMLFLLFQLGKDRYALEAGRVVEVAPLLSLKRLPQAPKGLAGIFNYRGQPVPAIDLCELATGKAASERLSTRIIIVKHYHENSGEQLLGLIAEHATEMLRRNPHDFVHAGVSIENAPYLGPVLMDPQGPIQWVNEQRLLAPHVRQFLLAKEAQATLQPPVAQATG